MNGLTDTILQMMDTTLEPEDYDGGGRAAALWEMPQA